VTGDRWSALLIRELFYGSTRFDEFQQRLGIATNILTQRLRRLVELGILTRTAYQQRPARHEYRLTEKGSLPGAVIDAGMGRPMGLRWPASSAAHPQEKSSAAHTDSDRQHMHRTDLAR